jgi:hypothetical protein
MDFNLALFAERRDQHRFRPGNPAFHFHPEIGAGRGKLRLALRSPPLFGWALGVLPPCGPPIHPLDLLFIPRERYGQWSGAGKNEACPRPPSACGPCCGDGVLFRTEGIRAARKWRIRSVGYEIQGPRDIAGDAGSLRSIRSVRRSPLVRVGRPGAHRPSGAPGCDPIGLCSLAPSP